MRGLRVRRRATTILALACVLAALPLRAQEDLDDVLGGFEDEDPAFEVEREEAAQSERIWDLSGSTEISASINYHDHESDAGTDYAGLQRLRGRLNLQLDVDLPRDWQLRLEGFGFYDAAYAINGRGDYSSEVLNEYELDADFGEVWLHGEPIEDVDVKLGRQIVIWGRSETLRVLDVLNPLDNREPGRTDLEDLRLPVGMLRVDGYTGDWTISAIAIPEIRFDDVPVVGSDFFPGAIEFASEEPDHFEDVEVAASVTGIFSGWDVSFHGAWFWNDTPRFEGSGVPTRLVHDRLWMLGSGGNYTKGSWLLKYEVAYLDGLGFFGTDDKSRFDALLGIEYYGLTDTTFVAEVVNRHLFDHDAAVRAAPNSTREDSQEIAFRLTRNFLRDTLHVTIVGVMLGWDGGDGSIARVDIDYDVLDALVVGAGVLVFQEGDLPPLDAWSRNDRVLLRAKWSF